MGEIRSVKTDKGSSTVSLSFVLRTSFAARRAFSRLRANKTGSEALILLGLSVPHLFFRQAQNGKKIDFFSYIWYNKAIRYYPDFSRSGGADEQRSFF